MAAPSVATEKFSPATIPSKTASKMRLCDADAIGFDLDHTLAKYRISELCPTIFVSVLRYLVEEKKYPKSLLDEPFDKFKDLCFRGLIFDTKKGNLLKIAGNGKILRATHGTKPMSMEEVKKVYGDDCMFDHVDVIFTTVNNIELSWIVLENYFDIPYGIAGARVVDLLDENAGHCLGHYDFWPDVLEAILFTYDPKHFALEKGGFFPAMKTELSKRIYKVKEEVQQWLKKIKASNIVTFMLTSSYFTFSKLLMDYIFESDWEQYFDMYLSFARKPSFFKKQNPFLTLNLENHREMSETVQLEFGTCYSQGNADKLTQFIAEKTGKQNPKIIYVGDSVRSDIFSPKKFSNWCNILILEEFRVEGWLESHDLYPEEKSALTSQFWGSFFHEPEQSNGKRYPNTIWARLVYSYADLVIPGLEYIADLPLDYEFSVFNGDPAVQGFYPAPPKSLQY